MTKPSLHIASEPITQSFAAQSPKQEVPALVDLLAICGVKITSENNTLCRKNGVWVVSDGTQQAEFVSLNKAINEFTKLIYT